MDGKEPIENFGHPAFDSRGFRSPWPRHVQDQWAMPKEKLKELLPSGLRVCVVPGEGEYGFLE